MHPLSKPFMALAAAALLAPAAQALTVGTIAANGNVVDTSFVLPGQIGLDLSFASQAPVSVGFTLEAADAGGSASFNSIVREVAGGSMTLLRLSLTGGATFSVAGSAATLNGDTVTTSLDAAAQLAEVSTPVGTTEFYIGDPLLLPGAQDWRIGFGALRSGTGFTLTVTQVPEPQSWALLLGGLGWIVFIARRRLDRRHPGLDRSLWEKSSSVR